MPGGIIDGAAHRPAEGSRVRTAHIAEMRRKSLLQPRRLREPRAPLGCGGALQQAGGELARHHIQGCKTVDYVFLVPRSHHWPMPLDPQGGAQRRHQWKARFILTQHEALPRLRFFFSSANSTRAWAWRWGSPRK